MNKTLKKFFIFELCLAIAIYLGVVFVTLEFDFREWAVMTRVIALSVFTSLLGFFPFFSGDL